jgi:peptidoglycan/LPS O-acetylase OafA/YrhL
METTYRRDIQLLRGLAVLAVLAFHAYEHIFSLGYLGVDVFFVISGFVVTPLIMRILLGQSKLGSEKLLGLFHFYKQRFFRLAPALAVVLTISTIIIFLVGPLSDHQKFARQGIATLLLAGNVGAYRYSGDYFSANPNPLDHTWSLSVEEQIYLFLPLVLMLVNKIWNNVKQATAVALGIILFTSFITFVFPRISQPLYTKAGLDERFSFYSPFDRVWQFCIGGLIFLLISRPNAPERKAPRLFHVIAVLSLIFVLFSPLHFGVKTSQILASLIAVVVILFKSLDFIPNSVAQKIEWVGDRSYSIYLIHMPLIYIAQYSPVTQIGDSDDRTIQTGVAVLISIIIGSMIYTKIENRFRNRGKYNPIKIRNMAVYFTISVMVPATILVGLERSLKIELKNSGLPVPSHVLPWNWDKNCQFYSIKTKVMKEPCKYGNYNSGKSILVIGDSHAASSSRAFIKVGRKNSMDTYVFTFEGCGFVLNKENFNKAYSYPFLTSDCLEHNRRILSFVKKAKPTIIVWSHRSSSIMVLPNTQQSRTQYNEMVLKNLGFLKKENPFVINIGSEPEFVPITTRFESFLNYKTYFSKIPFQDNYFWKRNWETDYFLNTLNVFCPQNVCFNKSESGWIFHDANHLSSIGADMLIPVLDRKVKKILSRV